MKWWLPNWCMANTNKEQQVQQVVFKGSEQQMTRALSKLEAWGVEVHYVVTEGQETRIYAQAKSVAIAALETAYKTH